MPRSRLRVAALHRAGAIIAILLGCVPRSHAESLQDIEGLSVKLDFGFDVTSVDQSGHRASGTGEASIYIYISSKTNIFLYKAASSARSNTGGVTQYQGNPTVFAIDRAGEPKSGQMVAWTMMNGHLTQIFKFIRGFAVTTIAIDPARLTCTFDRQYQADPQTGTVVSNLTGPPLQIDGYKVTSRSCEVKKGNVFGTNSE